MTHKKASWLTSKTNEKPVFIPPWLTGLDRAQRNDLYAQYRAATDSKKLKALAALTAIGLAGHGAMYIHGKNKMTRELAPERTNNPSDIPVNPENLGQAEKTSNIVIGSKPQSSILGSITSGASNVLANATNSGVTNAAFSNPSVIWGLGVGLPTLGVGTMAYKKIIDKLYKPPTEKQKELEEAQREFNALLSGDEDSIKESNLRKANGFISAFEERDAFTKRSNFYASWLPALAALSALSTGYVTANHLSKTDPATIKERAAREAMSRLRASQPPKLQAIGVDSPEEYVEMANLDNIDRNVIPVLKKKSIGKGSEFFKAGAADISPQQLAQAISQIAEKNPESVNSFIDNIKQNHPEALGALGGPDIGNSELTANLVKMLNGTGMVGGMKANLAKSQIMKNLNNLPPDIREQLTSPQSESVQRPTSMTGQIQPWQLGAAAASLGIGLGMNKPLLGAGGAAASLYGPQLWQKYVDNQATSDPSRHTTWMKGQNSTLTSPYILQSKPVTARPTGHLGSTIATMKNAVSTVGRGVKNTAVDVKRGLGNLAWSVKEPVRQAFKDTFTRPPANQNRASSFYDLTHFRDL